LNYTNPKKHLIRYLKMSHKGTVLTTSTGQPIDDNQNSVTAG